MDARSLTTGPRAAPLLDAVAGEIGRAALQQLLLRVSLLADDIPELAELRLEPIVVHRTGLAVLGATARAHEPQSRTDGDTRRLL